VPTDGAVVLLFWTESDDEDAVEQTLRADPLVEEVTRTADRVLYSVDWSPDTDALVRALLTPSVGVELLELFKPLIPPERGPPTAEQEDALATA